MDAPEDYLLTVFYMARVVITVCYPGLPEVPPLVGAQFDNHDPKSQLTGPSVQSSAEQWRSGPVALCCTNFASPLQVARMI